MYYRSKRKNVFFYSFTVHQTVRSGTFRWKMEFNLDLKIHSKENKSFIFQLYTKTSENKSMYS